MNQYNVIKIEIYHNTLQYCILTDVHAVTEFINYMTA